MSVPPAARGPDSGRAGESPVHPRPRRPGDPAFDEPLSVPPAPAVSQHRLLTEPRRPRSVRESPHAAWLVVATVCIGAFMGQLDSSIVTLAFPTLRHDFGASLGAVQWVGQAYLLVLIGLLSAVGRYADMIGRKLLYTYGFGVFVVGSALCAVAPNLPALIGFRALQGFGAAMLQANSVAIIASAMPRRILGRAIGVQAACQALGLALGPAVGGLLIGAGGWRLIFWVNVPAGIVGATLGWYLIPRSRHLLGRAPFDWPGLALFLPAVSALLLAVSSASRAGSAAAYVVGLGVATVVLGAAFVVRERRAATPMLDLKLFRRLPFTAGITGGLLSYLVLFGVLTVVPFYLEDGRGLSTRTAGLLIMVLPLALGLTSPVAGRLSDRFGPRMPTVAGMAVVAAALLALALAPHDTAVFLALLALLGIGIGAFTPPNNTAIMASVPHTQAGMASGVLNMTRGLGTSLGLAIAGLIYTVAAGSGAVGAASGHGFDVVAASLAGCALVAAAVAAARGKPRRS